MKEKYYETLESLESEEIALESLEYLEESVILEKTSKLSKTEISKERALALELEILEIKRGEF